MGKVYWRVAVYLAVLLSILQGISMRGAKILVFVAVGLASTLLFLVLGRLLVRLLSRGR